MKSPKRLLLCLALSLAFTLAPQAQTFKTLYTFGSKSDGPGPPGAPNVMSQSRGGNIYTTSLQGGGDVYRITPGGAWSILHQFERVGNFSYPDPESGVTLGTDGNFYGTTGFGGTSDNGTIFKITPTGNLTTLYNFKNADDGQYPAVPPVEGNDGNFYGVIVGGTTGCGLVYKITPSGTFSVLHEFANTDGCAPLAPLTLGNDGNFYGTTQSGGTSSGGVIYKVTPAGKLTVLYSLDANSGEVTGAFPLVLGIDGNFYGTTNLGGTTFANAGTVFKITPTGKFTVVYNFAGAMDGGLGAGLVQGSDGNLYGVDQGTIFKLTPQGVFSVLYTFDQTTGSPSANLVQHTNGIFYGGSSTVLYEFKLDLNPFVKCVMGSGRVGKTIQILGQGFTGATNVAFNGTAATFNVSADTYLTATVPVGATSGYIMVTTANGTLKSNLPFHVIP
jgi:uncharacterized repeat protein (TIGR03803 family)